VPHDAELTPSFPNKVMQAALGMPRAPAHPQLCSQHICCCGQERPSILQLTIGKPAGHQAAMSAIAKMKTTGILFWDPCCVF